MTMVSMVNQAAVEALCSATYLEDYIDCMDAFPDDLQRSISRLTELNCNIRIYLRELKHEKETYETSEKPEQDKQANLSNIRNYLVLCQQCGDEKLQIVNSMNEQIENRSRQMSQNLENLDPVTATTSSRSSFVTQTPTTSNPKTSKNDTKLIKSESDSNLGVAAKKRSRRQRAAQATVAVPPPVIPAAEVATTSKEEKKEEEEKPPKKKRKKKGKQKVEKSNDSLIEEFDIDPDEPTYCLCDRVSYGEMIGCDNDQCAIEWFHFDCIGLTNKPKGKWYCPNCRGDKPTVKRQDLK